MTNRDRSGEMVVEMNNAVQIADISGETVAIPAGAAGTVQDFQLQNFPVRTENGGSAGGPGDTSLSLTGTAFTNEVSWGTEDEDLENGDYYVNYLTGEGRGKKADTSTSMTASYKIATNSVPSSAPISVVPGGLSGYFYAEDDDFVSGDSPATLDVNAAIGRNANSGYVVCDGPGSFTFAIDEGDGYGDEITLNSGEVHDLSGDNADTIRITHVADSSYRVYAK